MQTFIHTANQLGAQRQPFFFLIDFEQKKPLIYPLAYAKQNGILFAFPHNQNVAEEHEVNKPFEFAFTPSDFNDYQKSISFVKQEIQAGNSYLLNLTCQTEIQTNYTLKDIFSASQAKYKLLLDNQFVCFSPECFVRIEQNKIYSYPMKGTINVDEENAQQKLLNSIKELTEHNTIVDLIRNDLALVSTHIQVTKYRYIEKVKTHRGAIYQTSSEICGQLSENWQENIGSMLAQLLPAGSISGAPKLKTVEIIEKAERGERGYYTGVFGYFDGEHLESAVAIRYIEQQNEKLIFRSGGGITSLSDIDEEYREVLEKVYVPISSV